MNGCRATWGSGITPTLFDAVRAQIMREEETLVAIREGRNQGPLRKILVDLQLTSRNER